MRMHISIERELVAELDRRVGRRKRSAFIATTIRNALEDRRRWDDVLASLGKISDAGHEWDADPAGWVHRQRRADRHRVG